MIVNRRVSQPIRSQLFLPSDDIAFETGRDPIVPIGGSEILQKANQVERNFLSYRGRANPSHRELDVLRDPGFQTIGEGHQETGMIILHLSGSEFVEISDEFSHVFRHFCVYSLPRRDILSSYFLWSKYTPSSLSLYTVARVLSIGDLTPRYGQK